MPLAAGHFGGGSTEQAENHVASLPSLAAFRRERLQWSRPRLDKASPLQTSHKALIAHLMWFLEHCGPAQLCSQLWKIKLYRMSEI